MASVTKIMLSIFAALILLGVIYLGTIGYSPAPKISRQDITKAVQG